MARDSVTIHERIIARLKTDNERLTADLAAARSPGLRDWRRDPSHTVLEPDDLDTKMKSLADKCAAQELELSRLRKTNDRHSLDLLTLRETNRTFDERNLEQSHMITRLQDLLNAKETVLLQLHENARLIVARYKRKKEQLAGQQRLVHTLTSELSAAQSSAGVLAAKHQKVEDECETLRRRVRDLQSAASKDRADLQLAASEKTVLQRELEELSADSRRRSDDAAMKLREFAAARAKLKAEKSELVRHVAALKEELTAVAKRRKEFSEAFFSDLKSYSKENRSLKEFAVALQRQVDSAHEIIGECFVADTMSSDTEEGEWPDVKAALENILRACGSEDVFTDQESPVEDWNADTECIRD
jgi:chromosome segregation ATPase